MKQKMRKSTPAALAVMLWMIGMAVTGVQTAAAAWGGKSPGIVTVTKNGRKSGVAIGSSV